jgi:hypothetical protein
VRLVYSVLRCLGFCRNFIYIKLHNEFIYKTIVCIYYNTGSSSLCSLFLNVPKLFVSEITMVFRSNVNASAVFSVASVENLSVVIHSQA